jgi:tRNA (guanine37-N1)-methyltransferase
MVLKAEPLFLAVESIRAQGSRPGPVILLSAQGKRYSQGLARELAKQTSLILLCGRYEGVDERVAEFLANEEISVGDYVLSGGELAAAVVTDVVVRLLPGALGNESSVLRESFSPEPNRQGGGLLDCPQYTRPAVFRGMSVPDVLLSGDHRRVAQWRRKKAFAKTWRNRPDLLRTAELDTEQQKWLADLEKENEDERTAKTHSGGPSQGHC